MDRGRRRRRRERAFNYPGKTRIHQARQGEKAHKCREEGRDRAETLTSVEMGLMDDRHWPCRGGGHRLLDLGGRQWLQVKRPMGIL